MGLAFLVCAGNHPRRVSERLGKRHKTVGMWAQQMISLVRRWLPDHSIKLMGDTAYSVLELGLHARHQQVTDASRLADSMQCSMSHLPNAPGTRLVVRGWWVNVFLPWSRSYRTRKPSGRSSP